MVDTHTLLRVMKILIFLKHNILIETNIDKTKLQKGYHQNAGLFDSQHIW